MVLACYCHQHQGLLTKSWKYLQHPHDHETPPGDLLTRVWRIIWVALSYRLLQHHTTGVRFEEVDGDTLLNNRKSLLTQSSVSLGNLSWVKMTHLAFFQFITFRSWCRTTIFLRCFWVLMFGYLSLTVLLLHMYFTNTSHFAPMLHLSRAIFSCIL